MAAAVAGRARPAAPPPLAELLDSGDENVRLEPAKAILDRHLDRPAIHVSLHRGVADDHIAALIETAHRRALEPIMLEDGQVEISTTPPSTT